MRCWLIRSKARGRYAAQHFFWFPLLAAPRDVLEAVVQARILSRAQSETRESMTGNPPRFRRGVAEIQKAIMGIRR